MRQRPEKFQCEACERQQHWSDLWPENREAWSCYQALAHRTVQDTKASAWVLQRFTAGWSWQRIADVLARVDVILDILAPLPPDAREDHGRHTET